MYTLFARTKVYLGDELNGLIVHGEAETLLTGEDARSMGLQFQSSLDRRKWRFDGMQAVAEDETEFILESSTCTLYCELESDSGPLPKGQLKTFLQAAGLIA